MFATPEVVPGAPPAEDDGRAHPPSTPHVRATHDVLMTWVFAAQPTDDSTSSSSVDPTTSPRAYVQGMSDLFSPLYVVLDGEQWLAYSCFETVMERNSDNFRMDQLGMKKQLSELQSLIRVMDRGLYRHFGESLPFLAGLFFPLSTTDPKSSSRTNQFAQPLLRLSLAPHLLQARVYVRGHRQTMGGLLHGPPRQTIPPLLCSRYSRSEPGSHG